ncbi:hypothetical protein KSP39_PZI002401 [Platanthera zijinensis]|uniref:Uncharacterized protein n=1 Tax=Platanthera zijinensis TaxID=2320716 RepID=A0AAP0BZE3_9ASPA
MFREVPFKLFRVGSQFFILPRCNAFSIGRDCRLWKKFLISCLKKMKDSCYPEEHYFPMLLNMQGPEGCTRYSLNRVDWAGSNDGQHHTYTLRDRGEDLVKG